jgi:anti-anti-sigma factor
MGMKTQVKKVGDTLVVSMDGELDFEMQDPIKEHLRALSKQVNTDSVPKKVIFNLEGLEFVGSCGISSFIQALQDFQTGSSVKPRFCNVKSEFRRLMHVYAEEHAAFEIFETEDRARKSFDH